MAKKKGREAADKAKKGGDGEADGGGAPAKAEKFSGPKLRKLREDKGLSIPDLSDRTKISKAVLQALEEERYASMPNARVYVRGFIRCVARELELDLDAVTASYLPGWERWMAEQGPDRY